MITMIFSDKVPLYRQLYLHIRDEIFQHKLKEGEYLPSKRALANHLNISQNTVINAYQQLQDEGYIQSEERKGFYVLPIDFQVRAPEEPELDVPLCTTELYKYDFSHNSIDPNSFPISTWGKLTKESLYNYSMDMTTQGDNKGHEKLRQALCNYLIENRGINVSADQIVIRSGVESMLPLVFHLIPDNLHFALEDPGYNV
ncbi:MAG: GntR family transcriptional regulator [Tissierellia bacterium]|nr:GntR family transcriptional regulator [Tissierellia bacterium]